MVKVTIDIDLLGTAIDELDGLQQRLSAAILACRKESPVSLPSLAGARMDELSVWLIEQRPELETRRDLAVLLDTGDGGSVSYDVAVDSLTGTEEMLGRELGERWDDIDSGSDPEDALDLAELTEQYARNLEVTAAMFTQLGPTGSAAMFRVMQLGASSSKSHRDEFGDAMDTLTDSLATASERLDHDWAQDFTHQLMPPDALSTDDNDRYLMDGTLLQGPAALAAILQGDQLDGTFLTGVADEIERTEQDSGMPIPDVWFNTTGEGDSGKDLADLVFQQMSGTPDEALDWLVDGGDDRQSYWFDQRDFSRSGYDGLAAMVDSAVTHPVDQAREPGFGGLSEEAMQARLEDAAQLTTTFFDLVANSPGFDPEHATASSDSMSHIMATYMPSVMAGVSVVGDADHPTFDSNLEMPPFGELGVAPLFQHDDLARIAAVAMSTEDGLTTVADGYQQLTTQRLQVLAADGTVEPGALSSILTDDAGLRGFLDRAVADSSIRGGASADEKAQYFSHVVSEIAGELPIPGAEKLGEKGGDLLKTGYEYAVNYGLERGEAAANDRWASAEDAARDSAVNAAEDGYTQSKYAAYRALVESGILRREDLIEDTYSGDSLHPYESLGDPRQYVDNLDALIIDRFDLDPNVISSQYFANYADPLGQVRPGG